MELKLRKDSKIKSLSDLVALKITSNLSEDEIYQLAENVDIGENLNIISALSKEGHNVNQIIDKLNNSL